MRFFCSRFDLCVINYDPYKISSYEKIFILLIFLILSSLFFYLFHKDRKRTEKKINNGKKLKSFRLHL